MDRKDYIGSSDAAAVLGLSRWRTPIQVWAEKTGKLPVEDISEKIQIRIGVKVENSIAEMFEEEKGVKVRRVNNTIMHPKYPYLGATLDRKIEGQRWILECKSTGYDKEWQDGEIPQEHLVQVYHQLACTGYEKAYIAVLILNQDFKIIEIERDEDVLNSLIRKEVDFWNEYVVKDVMPSQIMAEDTDVLLKLFPKAMPQQKILLGDEVNRKLESLEAIKQDLFVLEKEEAKLKNELKLLIKENEIGETGQWQIKWSK